MNKLSITAICLLFASSMAFAQKPCGTTKAVQDALTVRPQGIINQHNLEVETENFVPPHDRAVKVIPVVVHIIHNYGPENISKDQVENAISILNRDFQKLNADTVQVIQTFKGRVAAPNFEFRLAKLDPNGNCTDGITRTVSDLTFDADDNVKDLVSWPTTKYYNIWVVDEISFGAGGYAYLPGSSPCNGCDGVVVLNTQFGGIGTSNGGNFSERTLTHETGHWFNLNHTWGGNNDCGADCSGSDNVSDTPKTLGSCLVCDLAQNDCTNILANVQNYMDYSTCTVMFTSGQTTRMLAAANSSTGGRNNLSTNANLIATGTNDGYVASPCAPIADFQYTPSRTCVGNNVTFTDMSYGADVDQTWNWSWSIPGATPASSNLQNPTVTYNAPGTYNVTLTASNPTGNGTITKSQIITIYPNPGIQTAPINEGIENAQFPVNPSNPLLNWEITPTTGTPWTRTTTAAATGSASISVNCAVLDSAEKRDFLSPIIDLTTTNQSPLMLTFKVAYRYNGTAQDILKVYVSSNCGETWQVRYSKLGAQLATVANGTGSFVPSPSDWRTESVNINSLADKSAGMVRFEMTADGSGQRMYVDDINIGGTSVGLDELTTNTVELNVYPNPITNQTQLNINSVKGGMAALSLFDITGRNIANRNVAVQSNNVTYIDFSSIAPALPAGVYNIRMQLDGTVVNRRIVVN